MTAPSIAAVRPPLSAEHLAAVQRCLDLLERAQATCLAAAQALCPVPGFGNEWSALAAHDAVRADWDLVAGRLDAMWYHAGRGRCPSCGGTRPRPGQCCEECGFRIPADHRAAEG